MTDLNTMLEAERRRLETEQVDLQEKVRQGADQLAIVRSRIEHVLALLGKEKVTESRGEASHKSPSTSNNTSHTICDTAAEILDERNAEPMYYKELAQEVVRRGGVLNGATPWATARMVQDERFVRPTAKGFYALRRDYPTARNVGARLTARMVQDERFVRPTAKGFYALRRDYPTARNVGARLKGSRRRRGG